jgi:peptidoglycan hydrolase-like amidase
MTDQWDRFADSAGRTLDALGWDQNVDVYQPTESYTAGEGFEITYPNSPTTTLDGALEVPSDSADINAGGTTETADLQVYVRADVPVEINTAGESGEALTGLEIAERQYVVDTIEEQFDGMLALSCDEVDGWR